jgi:hypothetical protein
MLIITCFYVLVLKIKEELIWNNIQYNIMRNLQSTAAIYSYCGPGILKSHL